MEELFNPEEILEHFVNQARAEIAAEAAQAHAMAGGHAGIQEPPPVHAVVGQHHDESCARIHPGGLMLQETQRSAASRHDFLQIGTMIRRDCATCHQL